MTEVDAATSERRVALQPRGLRPLISAAYASSLGDGAFVAAAPLAAAALTQDPAAVAAVSMATYLPWLLVSPMAGALVDRWDLRAVLVVSDVLRALALIALAALLGLGFGSIPLLAAVACGVVVGQVFADTASQSVVVDLAGRDSGALNKANGHLSSATTAGKSFAGPPLGSTLYALVPWLPFALDGASFVASAGLVSRLPKRHRTETAEHGSLRRSMAAGARFLAGHRQLRALCLLIAAANLADFMALATFVLFAKERLGVSTAAYGLLLAISAIGGFAGGFVAERIARVLGPRLTVVLGLAIEAIAWPVVAFSTSVYVVAPILPLIELCAVVATVVTITLRQQLTPAPMLGRVISAFRTVGAGAAPLGAVLGGVLATTLGLQAPLAIAGIVLGVATVAALAMLRGLPAFAS